MASASSDNDASTSRDTFLLEDSSSSSPISERGNQFPVIITKEIEEEERKMDEIIAKEENKAIEQYRKERMEQEELEKDAQYKRLMHLLSQSQFYANFLWQKLESTKTKHSQVRQPGKAITSDENPNPESSGDTVSAPQQAKDSKVKSNDANTNIEPDQPKQTKRGAKKRPLITDVIDYDTVHKAKKRHAENGENVAQKQETPAPVAANIKVHINSMGLEVPDGQPELLEGGALRPYQLEGFEWLKASFENGVNGILADEMGLGKTIQVISIFCHLIQNGISGPFLVVAPLSTLPNWMLEFEKFAPSLPIVFFHGSKEERPKMYKKLRTKVKVNGNYTYPIILTSYKVVVIEQNVLVNFNWKYIVVDEGHALKNENAQISRSLRSFHSSHRLLLTGTPLQNNLKELWALLNFILPEIFDNLNVFQSLFDIEDITSSDANQAILQKEAESHVVTTLHQILTPFLLRRLKTDVELNLPLKKEVLVFCPLTDIQFNLYKATLNGVIEQVLKPKDTENIDVNVEAPRKKRSCTMIKKDYTFKFLDNLENLDQMPEIVPEESKILSEKTPGWHINLRMANPDMQMRKIANHPYLVQMPTEIVDGEKVMVSSEDITNSSGKMLALNAMLLKLHERGHKVLIFSGFKIMLNLIEEFATMNNYRYVRLDGTDKIDSRKENIRAFNTDPGIFLFLITTRAGGLGLNLTSADTVIIFDSDYNPQVDLQAMDRCHRIGQTKPVMVYRFISKGTVDEKIHKTACGKRKLEKIVIKKDLFKMNHMSRKVLGDLEELRELLESADHCKAVHSNGLVFTDQQLEELLDRSVEMTTSSHFQVLPQPSSQSNGNS